MPVPIIIAPLLAGIGTMLSRLFFTQGGRWAIALLASLGLALTTQTFVMGPIMDRASEGFTQLPPNVAQWLGYLNVDKYVSIVISAYVGSGIKSVILRRVTV